MININSIQVPTITRRLATLNEVEDILTLIVDAKEQMARNGVQQWNDAYPNEAVVLADICHQSLWLYGSANNACVTIVRHGSQFFIKRLIVGSEQAGHGVASQMIDDVVSQSISSNADGVRILTNHTNQPMINLVRKKHFSQINQLLMPDRPQFGNFIEFQKDVQSTKSSPN